MAVDGSSQNVFLDESGATRELTPDHERAIAAVLARKNVFITGKAGTGKSTLLQHIRSILGAQSVVAAPTGVAALNAGGITIHRLFGFPVTVTLEAVMSGEVVTGRMTPVLRSIDTLIVDEISMVRADLLDCMDWTLRLLRNETEIPFGGVQVVFVGDLYQLSPVVKDAETEFVYSRYGTPYFFGADVIEYLDFEIIELEKVFRQENLEFISILNEVRDNSMTAGSFRRLNERLDRSFRPDPGDFFITLTTTNARAAAVNRDRLNQLHANEYKSLASVDESFPKESFPTEYEIHFKVGAQVMMLTNHASGDFVNGSLGVIVEIESEVSRFGADEVPIAVSVELVDSGEVVRVEPHRWEVEEPSTRNGRLEYKSVGAFTQFPFRLAWAITIHKSQGKTFEKVILDLGRGTFAEGQLYVALSRCTELDGLVLHSEIKQRHVMADNGVKRFLAAAANPELDGDAPTFAIVYANTTGYERFDRIVEIAVAKVKAGELIDEISTLVNPNRDVSRQSVHGITASMVSAAPSLEEAWPLFARRINGCVLVAFDLDRLQYVLEHDLDNYGVSYDFGSGLCLREMTGASIEEFERRYPTQRRAPDALHGVRMSVEAFLESRPETIRAAPAQLGSDSIPMPRLLRRWDISLSPLVRASQGVDFEEQGLTPIEIYGERLALYLDDQELDEVERQVLMSLASDLGLGEVDIESIHLAFVEGIVQAARRDGVVSETESVLINQIADHLEVQRPLLTESPNQEAAGPFAGMFVCFTGDAFDENGHPLSRQTLEGIASQRGFVPVASVTIKKCDLLVTSDVASMSGKAKKARDLGKSIVSVQQFLDEFIL